MNNSDPFYEQKLKKLQLLLYLMPLVGWLPALWTLSRQQGTTEQRSLSRVSLSLNLAWLLAFSLLWMSSTQAPEVLSLRLLYLNGLLTSGYILACLGLSIRLWQGKSIRF